MNSPFFSILMSCCDVEPYLRQAIDSLLSQQFDDWECIIGIETSADRTADIAREYANRDKRFNLFFGPKSGSCSATRNAGIEKASGQYIIFLDGDDWLATGSLQRLHTAIAARPNADLYPCAIAVHNELTGRDDELRDNYPKDFSSELNGIAATLMLERIWRNSFPCPMLQMTVFRRGFLLDNNLRTIYGLRNQDSEFSPRALYLAKCVIPLHEPFYIYRIRKNSVTTLSQNIDKFHRDIAIRLKSLMAFHATISTEPDFNKEISAFWAKRWIGFLLNRWFHPTAIRNIPRQRRLETLAIIFADGFSDYYALLRRSSFSRRLIGRLAPLYFAHPLLRRPIEFFFARIYYPLTERVKRNEPDC